MSDETQEQILETLGMIYAELAAIRDNLESTETDTNRLTCKVCGETYQTIESFGNHAQRKHGAVTAEMKDELLSD